MPTPPKKKEIPQARMMGKAFGLGWNAACDAWAAYHLEVLEGLKFDKESKNLMFSGAYFNARIDRAKREVDQ